MSRPSLAILGIRGIPAAHGGFETFAERLALHLVSHGWRVTVYCQADDISTQVEDEWKGVHRVMLPGKDTPLGSMRFDWDAITEVLRRGTKLTLTLGYNTAIFGARLRLAGVTNLINMDGIEWARDKWGPAARIWFFCNDWIGCRVGDHLIADHPQIARHLGTRTRADRITMIPYGADRLTDQSTEPLRQFDLTPGKFITIVGRPEPENSILEMVRAFSARRRGIRLVVLGRYVPDRSRYHADVMAAASEEVLFAGAIYDQAIVASLRAHALLHLHGHRVGGTNPSLVEALGAGNAVLAHDNAFNRWVAHDAAMYFSDEAECMTLLQKLLDDPAQLSRLRECAIRRHQAHFTWANLLLSYEALLREHLPIARRFQERIAQQLGRYEDVENTGVLRG